MLRYATPDEVSSGVTNLMAQEPWFAGEIHLEEGPAAPDQEADASLADASNNLNKGVDAKEEKADDGDNHAGDDANTAVTNGTGESTSVAVTNGTGDEATETAGGGS